MMIMHETMKYIHTFYIDMGLIWGSFFSRAELAGGMPMQPTMMPQGFVVAGALGTLNMITLRTDWDPLGLDSN